MPFFKGFIYHLLILFILSRIISVHAITVAVSPTIYAIVMKSLDSVLNTRPSNGAIKYKVIADTNTVKATVSIVFFVKLDLLSFTKIPPNIIYIYALSL